MEHCSKIIQEILIPSKSKIENKVFSPSSLLLLLSHVEDSLDADKKEEINKFNQIFHFSKSAFSDSLKNIDPDKATIHASSSLWHNKELNLRRSPQEDLEVIKIDLKNIDVLNDINQWISDKTKGLIKQINIDFPILEYILINTVYLKCKWQKVFDSPSCPIDFKLLNGMVKKTGMLSMSLEYEIGYLKEKSYTAISIPYLEKKIAFEIYLPNFEVKNENFHNFIETIPLFSISNKFKYTRNYSISFPKFETSSEIDLTRSILHQQLPHTFSGKNPIFFKEDVSLQHQLTQKAIIKVNEKGTEAAAVTALPGLSGTGFQPELTFFANRPFFYLLRDNESNTILFSGILVEPPDFENIDITQEDDSDKNWFKKILRMIFKRE